MRAAITHPAEGEGKNAWQRMMDGGVERAENIYAGVNNAASAAAKGVWEGIKPVKKVFLSDVLASPKRNAWDRKWAKTDITYAGFIGAMHLGCLLAPFTFTWSAFTCFLVMYFITGCLGITLSYHRQLSHKVGGCNNTTNSCLHREKPKKKKKTFFYRVFDHTTNLSCHR